MTAKVRWDKTKPEGSSFSPPPPPQKKERKKKTNLSFEFIFRDVFLILCFLTL